MTRNPYVCSIHPCYCRPSGATRWVGGRPHYPAQPSSQGRRPVPVQPFHEAGHVLNAPQRRDYVDSADITTGETDDEEDANRFARDTLIPPDAYAGFLATGDFGEAAITAFSKAKAPLRAWCWAGYIRDGKVLPASYLNRLKKPIHWSARRSERPGSDPF